ncbi:MAG: AEC family transporter [Peptococcaceae bacterium]
MNGQLQVIITQMVVFSVLLGIGAIAARTKVLTTVVLDSLAKVMINITLPALIITLVPTAGSRKVLLEAFPFLICSFALILTLFLLGKFTARLGGLQGNTADIHVAQSSFGNVGFMGIPLLLALYGEKGMLYVSIFTVADQTLLWTLGTYLSSPDKEVNVMHNLKKLMNPTIVALSVALLFIILGINPQGVVFDTIKGLGDTTKYLSMVYIGGTLVAINFRDTLQKKTIFLIVLVKMIIAPLLIYFLMVSLGGGIFTPEAIMTLTLIATLPSMVTIAMLARAFGSDDVYSSECVFITTIFSIVTIPLVMFIISYLS